MDTRSRILEAALSCFLEAGVEQATVAAIRERSGVSNGALFHHFASKEAIADALYVEAMRSFQEGHRALLRRRARTLRAAVRQSIAHQLGWTEAHPDHARFVYLRGHLDWGSPGAAELAELNRDLAEAYRAWLQPFADSGELRVTSMLVLTAIVTGPAHAIAQRWLAGQVDARPASFVDELTDAAWAGLRGAPGPARRPQPPAATEGRVRMQLLAEDGSVLAEGEASARLRPSAGA